ncbi:hypothetical protein [Vibrio mangrovi]|uniref:Uncharacterized protein n=1 Tax=Vibrio mangrovi TaxID=474394 RepID=A0A1Y6IYI3_9VIBR|nr:hypothetical protein [Vibrio mangrovi]MDW6002377.1 hypothetical protein [Vibrio mangrovi]SMS02724.1 hypothetical protein VIM7927_04061 [Vibrio mangrovi]
MRSILFILATLASFSVLSAEWVGPLDTGAIEVHQSGVYFVQTTPIVTNISCKNYNYIKFPSDNAKLADRAMSIGLSASMARKKVKFYISQCDGEYLVASAIMLPE